MNENPIALRSKKKLMSALCELMHEKPYRDITITELCDRASLSRPAFYQNFGRIDDVLKRYLYELVLGTAQDMKLPPVMSAEQMAQAYLEVIDKNYEFMAIMIDNDQVAFFIEMCSNVFMGLPQTSSNLDNNPNQTYDDDYKRYYAAFISAGIATVLASWVREKGSIDKKHRYLGNHRRVGGFAVPLLMVRRSTGTPWLRRQAS